MSDLELIPDFPVLTGIGKLSGYFKLDTLPGGITYSDITIRVYYIDPEGGRFNGVQATQVKCQDTGHWQIEGINEHHKYNVVISIPGYNDIIYSNKATGVAEVEPPKPFEFEIDSSIEGFGGPVNFFNATNADGVLYWDGQEIPIVGEKVDIELPIPAEVGIYSGVFEGTAESISMSGSSGLTAIKSFGPEGLVKIELNGTSNLTSLPQELPKSVTDLTALLPGSGVKDFPNSWDFSNVKSITAAFQGMQFEGDVIINSLESLTSLDNVFGGASCQNLYIGGWPQDQAAYSQGGMLSGISVHDTFTVGGYYFGESFDSGFGSGVGAKNLVVKNPMPILTSINISSWGGMVPLVSVSLSDLPSVTSLNRAFEYKSELEAVSLGQVAAGVNCSEMFQFCQMLTTEGVTLSNLQPGNAKKMFYGCASLTAVPEGLDLTLATDLGAAFRDTGLTGDFVLPDLPNLAEEGQYSSIIGDIVSGTKVETVTIGDLPNMDFSQRYQSSLSFNAPATLRSFQIGAVPGCSEFELRSSDYGATGVLETVVLGDMAELLYIKGQSISNDFGDGWSLTLGDTPSLIELQFQMSGIGELHYTSNSPDGLNLQFYNCPNLTIVDGPGTFPPGSSITVQGCSVFNDPNVIDWDVSNLTSTINMFYGSVLFNQDISNWDVSNVESMHQMFNGSASFNQDLSGWCVSKIPEEPGDFDVGATSWVLPRPIWGTCPA